MAPSDSTKAFIPALSYRRLTPLYDPVLRWLMREEGFKQRLIDLADIRPEMRVLDLGCGTGTLTIMVKRRQPRAELVGIDPDPEVIARARAKASGAAVTITFERGSATDLPYPDQSFDRVLASMMTHHLTHDEKRWAFAEVLRVLRPGGRFHVVDLGPARSWLMSWIASILRRLEESEDNFAGRLPGMLAEAGFANVTEEGTMASVVGPLAFLRAEAPRSPGA